MGVAYSNKVKGIPAPALASLLRSLNAYSGNTTATGTSLNKAPQEQVLAARFSDLQTIDIVDFVKAFIGSMCHDYFARTAGVHDDHNSGKWTWGGKPSEIAITGEAEVRLYADLHGLDVSAQFDYYDIERGILWDYKFMSAWGRVFQPDMLDHRHQHWNTRTIMAENEYPDPLECKNLLIYTDWSASKATGKYPEYPIEVFSHPPASLAECQAWTKDRIQLRQQAEQQYDRENTLPQCSDGERWAKFRKGKAPVYSKCESYCSVAKWCPQWQSERF